MVWWRTWACRGMCWGCGGRGGRMLVNRMGGGFGTFFFWFGEREEMWMVDEKVERLRWMGC